VSLLVLLQKDLEPRKVFGDAGKSRDSARDELFPNSLLGAAGGVSYTDLPGQCACGRVVAIVDSGGGEAEHFADWLQDTVLPAGAPDLGVARGARPMRPGGGAPWKPGGARPSMHKLSKLKRLAGPGRRLLRRLLQAETLVDRIAALDADPDAFKRCIGTRVIPRSSERVRAFSSISAVRASNVDVCAVVQFNEDGTMAIGVNIEHPNPFGDFLYGGVPTERCEYMQSKDKCVQKNLAYKISGYADLQALVGWYMSHRQPEIIPMFPMGLRKEEQYNLHQFILAILMLVFLHPAIPGVFFSTISTFFLAVKLIHERQSKLREGMRVMGLRDRTYFKSWSRTCAVQAIPQALVLTAVVRYAHPSLSVPGLLFVFQTVLTYFLNASAFTMAASTFFTSEVLGGVATTLLLILSGVPAVWHLSSAAGEPWSAAATLCAMALPPFGLYASASILLLAEARPGGFDDLPFDTPLARTTIPLSLASVVTANFGAFVLWRLIYMYLDQVLRHGIGISRPCYFPLLPSFYAELFGFQPAANARVGEQAVSWSEARRRGRAVEPLAEMQLGLLPEKMVSVKNLSVTFRSPWCGEEDVRAVDDVSFQMFAGEIFVLLGHNGAGKSTTIGTSR
jgi:hypothetical protein